MDKYEHLRKLERWDAEAAHHYAMSEGLDPTLDPRRMRTEGVSEARTDAAVDAVIPVGDAEAPVLDVHRGERAALQRDSAPHVAVVNVAQVGADAQGTRTRQEAEPDRSRR